MKGTGKLIIAALLVGTVYVSGCKKDKDTSDSDTQASADNSFAENTFGDVVTMSDQAAEDGSLTTFRTGAEGTLLSNCATVTHDTVAVPHVLTIDFGTSNCLCNDGKLRRGKIMVSYAGHYRDSASTHTFYFDNYFVNNYGVAGSKTVTNMGHNSAGNLYFTITVNGTITDTSGNTMTWVSNRQREWTAGEATQGILGWLDDVYSITGSASGTSFNGTSYTATITDPLLIKLTCWHIIQGKFEFTPSGKATRYVDYGNGVCDALATVTINGNTYNITLR